MQNPRGEAMRHLALAVAAAATVVWKIERQNHLHDLLFDLGRNVEAMERDKNVVQLHATAR